MRERNEEGKRREKERKRKTGKRRESEQKSTFPPWLRLEG